MPLHVVEGIGDPLGLLRDPLPVRKAALKLAADAGRGNSTYQDYDQRITEAAEAWLEERAGEKADKPWVLFVSLVCPHFPLIARPEWYDLYPEDKVPGRWMYAEAERPTHPYIKAIRESMIYDQGFDESKVRKALAAYFGMVSYLDDNIGRLIRALDDTGLADTRAVIYTSDHGDNLGTRGLWGKSTMYEESVGVPMMMAGPEVPIGVVCREPVSLVDSFPTILDCVGVRPDPGDRDLPGASLMDVVAGRHRVAHRHERVPRGRSGGGRLHDPPGQLQIRALRRHAAAAFPSRHRSPGDARSRPGPRLSRRRRRGEAALRRTVDPEAADRQARADQAAKIAQLGGREAILARGAFGYSSGARHQGRFHDVTQAMGPPRLICAQTSAPARAAIRGPGGRTRAAPALRGTRS